MRRKPISLFEPYPLPDQNRNRSKDQRQINARTQLGPTQMISSEICILSGGEEILDLADFSKHKGISQKHHSPERSRDDLKRHLDFVPRPDEYKSISPIRAQDAKIGEATLKLSYYYDEYNPKNVGKKVSLFSRKQSGMAKSGNEPLVPDNY